MTRLRQHGLLLVAMGLLVAIAAACATDSGGEGPGTSSIAQVDSIEFLMLESFPVQVTVMARGNLPGSCIAIDQITQERQGNTFKVTITTRLFGQLCTGMEVPFEEAIALEVRGLPAGTYTVDVNGVTGSFTLDVDNVL